MIQKIKDFLKISAERGMNLPMAYDAAKGGPSITLLIFYIAMIMTAGSLTAFHFLPDTLLQPALLTLTFLAMAFVFYRLRNLDKVKLDLDDRSIELDGGGEDETGNTGASSTTSGSEGTKPQGE
jgi:hypothetical protein